MGPSALSLEQGIKAVADTANQIRAEVRRSEFRSVDVTWVSTLATTGRFPGLRSRSTTARSAARGGTDELADSLQDSLPPRAGPLMLTLTDGTFWHPSEIA